MKINVYDEVGSFAITVDDGEKLFGLISHELLEKEENIILDFENVSKLCAVFLNASIGKLIRIIGLDEYNKVINVENLNDVGQLVLESIIKYYEKPLEYREKAEKIMEEYWVAYAAEN